MRYYDLKKHWTKKIEPHLTNKQLNNILVRDFNKFAFGRWRQPFVHGQYPCEFESCDWDLGHKGPAPRYWKYTKHAACHWLVNFNLKLAMLVAPQRRWRIVTSVGHSTVWDGAETLFEFNFLAFGIPAQECFDLALQDRTVLPAGKYLRTYFAEHFSKVSSTRRQVVVAQTPASEVSVGC
jgi:hypothetical protein